MTAQNKPLTRIGWNVNGTKYGPPNIFFDKLKKWRPAGITLVGGGVGFTREVADEMAAWGGIINYREYKGDAVEKYMHRAYPDREKFYSEIMKPLDFQRANVWVNIGNEPPIEGKNFQQKAAEAAQIANWYADIIHMCLGKGHNIGILNGIAMERAEIEAGWLDPVWIALGQHVHERSYGYSRAMMNWHSYCSLTRAIADGGGAEPGNPEKRIRIGGYVPNLLKRDVIGDIRNYPTQAEILKDPNNFIMGFRYRWGTDRANGIFNSGGWGTTKHDFITVGMSEYFLDDMPHLWQQFPDIMRQCKEINGGNFKGIKTCKQYKAWQFADVGWSAARGFCEELLYDNDTYTPEVAYLAIWGWNQHEGKDGLGNWFRDDDISEYEEFLELFPQLAAERYGEKPTPEPTPIPVPPPTPLPEPAPFPPSDDVRWQRGVIVTSEATAHNVTLHAQPSASSPVVYTLTKGIPEFARFIAGYGKHADVINDKAGFWIPVQIGTGDVKAWVFNIYVSASIFAQPGAVILSKTQFQALMDTLELVKANTQRIAKTAEEETTEAIQFLDSALEVWKGV